MHFLMLVTTSLPDGATSEQARWTVADALLNDDSFCGSGGRFGSPLCDWFVIGGRWTGILAQTMIGERYQTSLTTRFPALLDDWQPELLVEQHGAELDALWAACGGTAASPYTRTSYQELGYEDDAMLLTKQLYERYLAKYQGCELVKDAGHCEYIDLDGEPLAPDFCGEKWLVVVDYHS